MSANHAVTVYMLIYTIALISTYKHYNLYLLILKMRNVKTNILEIMTDCDLYIL